MNYKIDSDLLLKTFRNNKEHSQCIFKNAQAKYIYHKKGSAFMYFSLKKPWHILEKELESKYVNNITYSTKEDVDLSLYNVIKKDIDFLNLPFFELNIYLKIT